MIQAALPRRPDLVRAKPLVLDPAGGEAVERAAADRRGDRDEADPIVDRDLTSRPSSIAGKASAWIGVIST